MQWLVEARIEYLDRVQVVKTFSAILTILLSTIDQMRLAFREMIDRD